MLAAVLVALVAAVALRGYHCATHPVARCHRCSAYLGRIRRPHGPRLSCAACTARERRDAESAAQMAAARRRADREHAEAEVARVASRFPVRRAGTFGRIGGAFVLEGWVFEDPRALADAGAPAATFPQHLTLSRWQTVYGWRLEELHAEAHGAACTCL
jgi:hypothetical protein